MSDLKSVNKVGGFTFVELVIVIIILGIVSVVAIPKIIDLGPDSKVAATKSVAGALSSANTINYSIRKVNSSKGAAVANCTDVGSLLQSAFPSGYTITAAAVAVDTTIACTLTGPGATTATFSATGVS